MKRVSLVRQRSGSWQSCVFSWRLYGKIWFLPFPSSRGCLHFWARGPLSPSPKPMYSRDLVMLSSLISLSPSFLPFFFSLTCMALGVTLGLPTCSSIISPFRGQLANLNTSATLLLLCHLILTYSWVLNI